MAENRSGDVRGHDDTVRVGVLEILLAMLMVGLLVVVFIQVIVRYATYQPLAWTEEVARLLFIWSSMIGAVIAAKRGSHFAVTLIFDLLPLNFHRTARVTLQILEACFYALFTWSAFIVMRVAHNQLSPSLEFPMSISYAALAIPGVFMTLFALGRAAMLIREES